LKVNRVSKEQLMDTVEKIPELKILDVRETDA
jgi:hypothetical protein